MILCILVFHFFKKGSFFAQESKGPIQELEKRVDDCAKVHWQAGIDASIWGTTWGDHLSEHTLSVSTSLPQTNALAEATLKNSKDTLSNEQKILKGLKKGFDEVICHLNKAFDEISN